MAQVSKRSPTHAFINSFFEVVSALIRKIDIIFFVVVVVVDYVNGPSFIHIVSVKHAFLTMKSLQ